MSGGDVVMEHGWLAGMEIGWAKRTRGLTSQI